MFVGVLQQQYDLASSQQQMSGIARVVVADGLHCRSGQQWLTLSHNTLTVVRATTGGVVVVVVFLTKAVVISRIAGIDDHVWLKFWRVIISAASAGVIVVCGAILARSIMVILATTHGAAVARVHHYNSDIILGGGGGGGSASGSSGSGRARFVGLIPRLSSRIT